MMDSRVILFIGYSLLPGTENMSGRKMGEVWQNHGWQNHFLIVVPAMAKAITRLSTA
jgi:hypothetical protein